jgi:hypothetical protein
MIVSLPDWRGRPVMYVVVVVKGRFYGRWSCFGLLHRAFTAKPRDILRIESKTG